MLPHNSITDYSGASIQYNNVLSDATIRATTGIANSRIFRQEYIKQMNESLAMTLLLTKFKDHYTDHDSGVLVFVSALLFPLTYGFSHTFEIINFKTFIYAPTFLSHH